MSPRTVVVALVGSAALTVACGTVLSIDEDDAPRPADAAVVPEGSSALDDATMMPPADAGAARHLTVFVSSQVLSGGLFGDSGMLGNPVMGHAGADLSCAQEAAEAALAGSYRAWLSESGHDIIASLPTDADWSMPVGGGPAVLVFPSRSHIAAGMPPLLPLDHTARGQMIAAGERAWTGTTPSGTATNVDCKGWTIVSGANATYGLVGQRAPAWTSADDDVDCIKPYHLYCFGY